MTLSHPAATRRALLLLCVTGIVGAAPVSASAATTSCPGFSTKGKTVSSLKATAISCSSAKSALTRALAARKGRASWTCAGLSWSAAGQRVSGRSGRKRVSATVR